MPDFSVEFGFSLIELLVVMLIVGIVLTLANPTFSSHMLRLHRKDALLSLLQDQIILEHCFAENNDYSANCANYKPFPHLSKQGYYLISISDLGDKGYKLTAVPTKQQVKDTHCAILSINQSNKREAADGFGTEQKDCWNT